MPTLAMRNAGSAAVLLLLFLPSMPAVAATLVVDDDRRQCRAAHHTSIRDAVAAAAPGDTVRVCAGLYEERVHVNKSGLRLEGPRKGKAGSTRTLRSRGEAVIRSPNPLILGSDRVVVDGFTIQVRLDDEGEGQGISLSAPGSRIRNNVFDDDYVSGIIPYALSGATTVIERNHFIGRWGIAADTESGLVANLVIRDNLFTNAGIGFWGADGSRHFDIQILRNRFRHDPRAPTACVRTPRPQLLCRPLITLSHVIAMRIEQNQMASGHGMLLTSVRDVTVLDNALRAGTGDGIVVHDPGEGVLIGGNRIRNHAGTGIVLDAALETLIEGNEIDANLNGIRLVNGARSNEVRINDVEDNREVGIQVQGSEGNRFTENEARGNGTWDCADDTVGMESVGTANTWTGNEGSRSTPAGLCGDRP